MENNNEVKKQTGPNMKPVILSPIQILLESNNNKRMELC